MDEKQQTPAEDYSYLLKNRWPKKLAYNAIGTILVGPILRRWLDIEMINKENVPKGPCLFVTNHAVYFDALVIGLSFRDVGKKVHGWIEEGVYQSRERLYRTLELIPVKVGKCQTRAEQRDMLLAFRRSKDISRFWVENTNDGLALTSDGLAESCLDENDKVKPLPARDNHSGPAELGYSFGVPIIPVTAWIPEQHRRGLLIASGKASFKYLEANRKIPYKFYFNTPLNPRDFSKRPELQAAIREEQIKGWNILETLSSF